MSGHFNIVLSRLKNLLKGIAVKDPDFDNLCTEHAALTAQIRKLDPDGDPEHSRRDSTLRHRRAALEDEILAIMQANTRI